MVMQYYPWGKDFRMVSYGIFLASKLISRNFQTLNLVKYFNILDTYLYVIVLFASYPISLILVTDNIFD